MKINLISGDSYLLINEKVSDIIKESTNITTFDMLESSIDDVLIEANYVSMFPDDKYIIVRNANFFGTEKGKESDIEKLINYLEHPNEKTIIIFICPSKLDLRKKITKLIKDKYNLINIPSLKSYEIENKLSAVFKKHNFKIDSESIKYIVSNSLNNYDLAMNEIAKIMLYYEEGTYINYNDIVNITAKSLNTNNFLFVDAVVEGNLEKSLELLKDLKVLKQEPTVIFALLARDFRLMLQIKNMLIKGEKEYDIMRFLGLQDWQLDRYIKKIFPYKVKELEEILVKLANIDLDIKTGKIDKYIALELFILDICE